MRYRAPGGRTALLDHRRLQGYARVRLWAPLRAIRPLDGRPEPLVSRPWRLEVPERMAADGTVLLPIEEAALACDGGSRMRHRILAVSFLHSYRTRPTNPAQGRSSGLNPRDVISLSRRSVPRSANTTAPRPPSPMPMSSHLWRATSQLGKDCRHRPDPPDVICHRRRDLASDTASRFPIRLSSPHPRAAPSSPSYRH